MVKEFQPTIIINTTPSAHQLFVCSLSLSLSLTRRQQPRSLTHPAAIASWGLNSYTRTTRAIPGRAGLHPLITSRNHTHSLRPKPTESVLSVFPSVSPQVFVRSKKTFTLKTIRPCTLLVSRSSTTEIHPRFDVSADLVFRRACPGNCQNRRRHSVSRGTCTRLPPPVDTVKN